MKKNSSASSGCWPGWRPSWRTSKKKIGQPFFLYLHYWPFDQQGYRCFAPKIPLDCFPVRKRDHGHLSRYKALQPSMEGFLVFLSMLESKKKKRTRRKGSKRFGKKLSFFTIQHTLTLDELFPGVLILDGVWKRDVKGLMEYLCCI